MKHLKTYNKSAFSKEDYYEKVLQNSYHKHHVDNELSTFTENELSELKKLVMKRDMNLLSTLLLLIQVQRFLVLDLLKKIQMVI
jgi:DNA primase catalytic subunit